MKNKLKVVAIVASLMIGMVLYKEHFERQEKAKKDEENNLKKKRSERADKHRWN